MTLQTVRVVIHPPESVKGIGMRVLFPFLEVFEMTEPAFSVADIVRLFFPKRVARKQLQRIRYSRQKGYDKKQDDG
jgi:hypothetical protein